MKLNRKLLPILVLAVLSPALTSLSAREPAHTIKLKLDVGESFRVEVVYALRQGGISNSEVLQMAAAMSCTVSAHTDSLYRLKVAYDSLYVKSEGLFGTEANSGADLSTMDNDITDNDYLMTLLFKAMIGLPFEMVVDERMNTHDVGELDSLHNALVKRVLDMAKLENQSLHEMLLEAIRKVFTRRRFTEEMGMALTGYPATPVRVGDSWQADGSSGAQSLSYLTEATYTLRRARAAGLVVAFDGRIRPDTSDDGKRISGTQSGMIIFDRASGLVVQSEVEQQLEIDELSLTGGIQARVELPGHKRRRQWQRVVDVRDSIYGYGAIVRVGVRARDGVAGGGLTISALERLSEDFRRQPGMAGVTSILNVPIVSVDKELVSVTAWGAQRGAGNAVSIDELRKRADAGGRFFAADNVVMAEIALQSFVLNRNMARHCDEKLTALRKRLPDTELLVAAPALAGYCRIMADTVIAVGPLVDQWSPLLGEQGERDELRRLCGGLTHIDYSFETGKPNGVCDGPVAARIDSFTAWLRQQPEVVRVESVRDLLPLLDSVPGARTEAQRLALLDMMHPQLSPLANRLSVSFSALRLTAVVRAQPGPLDSLWARSVGRLRAAGPSNDPDRGGVKK